VLAAGEGGADPLGELAQLSPGVEDVAVLFDCLERLLAGLPDNYREIVLRRLEGDSIEQIAAHVQRSQRTVLRVLAHVQQLGAHQLEPPS